MPDELLSQLKAVLTEEGQALLAADFDRLEALAEQKEALLGALSGQPLPKAGLDTLRKANLRNQAFLGAVAKGIAGVRSVVMQHHNARNALFYQKDGTQNPLLPQSGKLARKA
ncbi:hypothetical protein [Roseinatronobacter alkalisoli]|uniref:Flagellar protein FlgN n=1 Tax=Roseinatronobacter alkalisoli TaxID=3028235 RepID=A0ABT5TCU3_9RHOB|nr:hypothetical protein [Roseinatronobacter sp. HJB301]MDD7971733.1 hypothetical protein [Roseinatronobacter sp. HJB301]